MILQEKSYKILTAFDLKNIALLTMVIDHIGFCFYPDVIWLRIIGRMAFILYAFLLVEGFTHTSNLKAYKEKLLFWGLLSEIPYDLVYYNSWSSFEGQNIFFTLLIGLLGLEYAERKKNTFLTVLIIATTMILAKRLNVEYSMYGVTVIYLFYYFGKRKILYFSSIPMISLLYGFKKFILQSFAFLGLIPIYFYNGKRGRKTGVIYYSFYAMHLLLFYLIKEFYLE